MQIVTWLTLVGFYKGNFVQKVFLFRCLSDPNRSIIDDTKTKESRHRQRCVQHEEIASRLAPGEEELDKVRRA